jgi:LPPG:FO 2-phospho-L-lactate transferase
MQVRRPKVVALSGGVGGARLAYGLSRVLSADDLAIVVNTGDDFEHLGLWICPDVDSVLYALSERNDRVRGWGRSDETWTFMDELARLGAPTWFQLGDRDLATHILRTEILRSGGSLSAATRSLAVRQGLSHAVLPMSDDPVATVLETPEGDLSFQQYFVERKAKPRLRGVRYEGAASARPNPEIVDWLASPRLERIIICPSNPILSIDPLFAIEGLKRGLKAAAAPIVAVSPLRRGRAFKGPTVSNMTDLGLDPTAIGVARHYDGLIDGFILDDADAEFRPSIEEIGVSVTATDSAMTGPQECVRLARDVLAFQCDKVVSKQRRFGS